MEYIESMDCRLIAVVGALIVGYSGPLAAEDPVDLSGFWAGIFEPEDAEYRGAGPAFGDFEGLPLNEAGLAKAQSWNPDDDYTPESLSRPHSPAHIMRSSFPFRIIQEGGTITFEMEVCEQVRTVYMDGRSHPPDDAPHSYMGHSIGHWEGQTLVVDTTHVRENYVRRNGVVHSDQVRLTERYTRDGDYLLLMIIVDDPVFFSVPFTRVIAFQYRPDITGLRPYPC